MHTAFIVEGRYGDTSRDVEKLVPQGISVSIWKIRR